MTQNTPPESGTARNETPAAMEAGAVPGDPNPMSPTLMKSHHDSAFVEEERFGADNLDLIKALGLGLMVTAFFYQVFPIPFLDQGRLLALFENDNWVSPVIVAMTSWSFFILMFKFLRFRFQNSIWKKFRQPAITQLLNRKIYGRDADRVIADLKSALDQAKVKKYERSTLYRRVLRLLYVLRGATRKEGLDNLTDYQGQIDQKRMENGYTILHVFIWAIPILGFIGTVMGIGMSVNEFAQFIQVAEAGGEFNSQMRSALGSVTGGLAIAFNTTFLALVLVIPVMLLTSLLYKNEEEFLLKIEEFCLEDLLPLMHVEPGETALAEGYEEHLHRIMRLSDTWLGQFEPLVQNLSRQAEMMGHQLDGIQPLVKDFTDRLIGGGRQETAQRISPSGAASAPPAKAEGGRGLVFGKKEEDPPSHS